MKRFAIVLLCISLVTLSRARAQQAGYYPGGGADMAPQVSLIKLIANPQAFDGKVVRVVGYLHVEFEGNAIYLHRDDFEHAIYENSIWIHLPKDIPQAQIKTVNDRYVICTARFIASRHGHMGMFSGELEDVRRLEPWR